MHVINLRKHYPHYTEDIFLEVSDEVYKVILLSIRQKNNYDSRMYYHKAHYSLDCGDSIENDALYRMPSPEEILTEIFCPRYGVRYLTISNYVDNLNKQEMDITPFRNIL